VTAFRGLHAWDLRRDASWLNIQARDHCESDAPVA
jgi:hypothetical protein